MYQWLRQDCTILFDMRFPIPRSSHMVRSRGKERNNFVLFKILSDGFNLCRCVDLNCPNRVFINTVDCPEVQILS